MKNSRGYKSGNEGKETKRGEKREKDRSERGFGFEKLSVRKALPLALVLAMVFSIAGIVVSGEFLPLPQVKPKVNYYTVTPSTCNLTENRTDSFTYYLNITAARNARITALEIYQPANNTWEEIELNWDFKKHEANETNITIEPFIKQSQGGHSSYRFKYEDGILNTTLGPYPGPSLPKPVEVKPPHVNFSQIMPTDSNESDYHVYSGDTTAFDYAVNAKSNVDIDRWFDISLRICDPVEGEWKQKGENKPEYFKAGESKNLTWRDIRPFESLNESRIDEYIGKQSKFAFVYAGNKSENLTGPVLVVAFDNPKCNKTEVSYEDWFNYSIDVNGSRALNITLEYLCEGKWINDSINNPEWNYTDTDIGNWTNHTWDCQAINTWEDVRFRWWEKGNETKAAKMTSLELGMEISQLSASKPRRSYPVPVIVKVKEK